MQTQSVTYYTDTSLSGSTLAVGSNYLEGAVGGTVTSTHTYTAGQWAGRSSSDITEFQTTGSFAFREERTANQVEWSANAAKQTGSTTDLHISDLLPDTVYTSAYAFQNNGNINSAAIADGQARTVAFTTDFRGQVLDRTETPSGSGSIKHDRSLYLDGMRWGSVGDHGFGDAATSFAAAIANRTNPSWAGGSGAAADFDQSYDPINPTTDASAGYSYTVQAGDTLQSVALALWGDAGLWYLIAEANTLNGSSPLAAGQQLAIPNKVHNLHNTADTFRPYDPNQARGNLDPTQAPQPRPPSQNKGCGAFGQILLIAIAVAVTIVTAGAAAAALSPTISTISGGISALGAGTAGVGVGITAGAIGGAAGSIVSQGVGVATGLQDKFSWKGVALAAIAAGVGGGLAGRFSSLGQIGSAVARGAAGNAITQGLAIATGLQNHFDWAGVAIGGVIGGASAAAGSWAAGSHLGGWQANAIAGVAGGVTGAAARSLITGTDFGDNLRAVLPDVVGVTVGNTIAGGLANRSSGNSLNQGLANVQQYVDEHQLTNGPVLTMQPSYAGAQGDLVIPGVLGSMSSGPAQARNAGASPDKQRSPAMGGVIAGPGQAWFNLNSDERINVDPGDIPVGMELVVTAPRKQYDSISNLLVHAFSAGIGDVRAARSGLQYAIDHPLTAAGAVANSAANLVLDAGALASAAFGIETGRSAAIERRIGGAISAFAHGGIDAARNGRLSGWSGDAIGHAAVAGLTTVATDGLGSVAIRGIGVAGDAIAGLRAAESAAPNVDAYVAGLYSKATPTSTNAGLFEVEQTGALNYRVLGGGTTVDIDGYAGTTIQEAKYVGDLSSSPYVDGSNIPDFLRAKILTAQQSEFARLGAVISDPTVPFTNLNVLTNESKAVPYFQNLMTANQIPGKVIVVPTKVP